MSQAEQDAMEVAEELSPTFATQRKKRLISGLGRLGSRISKGSLVEKSV